MRIGTLSAPVCWGLLFTSRCASPTPPPRGACWAPKEFFLWVANGALAFSCCLVVGLFRQRLRELTLTENHPPLPPANCTDVYVSGVRLMSVGGL